MTDTARTTSEDRQKPRRKRWPWVVATLAALLAAQLLTLLDLRHQDNLLRDRITDEGGTFTPYLKKRQGLENLLHYFTTDDDYDQLFLPPVSPQVFRDSVAKFTSIKLLRMDLANSAEFDREAASRFTELVTLTVTADEEPEVRDYSFLAGFPKVGALTIAGEFHDDGFWQYLPEMKELQYLTVVSGPDVRGEGIPDLPQSSLLDIRITGSAGNGGNYNLLSLLTAPKLKTLSLSGKIDVTQIRTVAVSASLESLYLSHTQLTDRGLPVLSDCSSLRSVELSNNQITGESLDRLAATNLSYLSLDHNPLTAEACRNLARFPHLRWLNLDHTGIESQWLASWTDSPLSRNLESLDLSGNKIGPEAIGALRSYALYDLTLDDNPLSEEACRQLANCAKFGQLSVKNCGIQGAWMQSWKDSPLSASLESLSLSDNEINDEAIEVLMSFSRLRDLSLSGSNLSEEGLFVLLDHPTLRYLSVDNSVSEDTVYQFQLKAIERGSKFQIYRPE